MTQQQAIELIDQHKNGLVDVVEMLDWTWLRVIIAQLSKEEWEKALDKAEKILAG